MNLSDLGEFGSIERMRSMVPDGTSRIGIGDDGAVLDVGSPAIVCSTDALVEGVHFRLGWSTPADVGYKAVAVNVSDVAAMGATPKWLLLVLAAPPHTPVEVLDGIYAGIAQANERYGCQLVGGDMVRSEQLTLSMTAIGELDGEPLLRSRAEIGDALAVTGPLGRAAAGVDLLLSGDPHGAGPVPVDDVLRCLDAHRRPVARVGEGRRLADAGVHAGIDVTDGLASDARRIAEASRVGIEIDGDALPVADEARAVAEARGWDVAQMVLGGGEDLELLVAVPSSVDLASLGLIACGRVVDEGAWLVIDGERRELAAHGYDHFKEAP